jgi:putative hydrolase of HD superfamily
VDRLQWQLFSDAALEMVSVDVNRVIAILLVHELGQIDAGDEFVFAQDGWDDRKVVELRAVERICDIAPLKVADWLITLWKEFDGGRTPEARFTKAMDRCMPVLLNLSNQGGTWLENGVT